MTKHWVRATFLTFLATAGFGGVLRDVPTAGAQAAPVAPEPGDAGSSGTAVEGQGMMGGGNYDYFTASLRPELAKYLSLVTHRHASERVWAVFRAGRYSEALGDCIYSLERFPNHPRALNLIGEIAKAMNQAPMAIPYYEYALKLYPQYAFTHAQYGHFLLDIGAVPAGVSQLREALRIDPTQFQAKAWLAEALAAHPEMAPGPSPASGNPPAPAPAPAPGSGEPQGSR